MENIIPRKFVTITQESYDALVDAAENYENDLSSGLEDGTYERGEEELESIRKALDEVPIEPQIYAFVEGGNLQGASGNIPISFNIFDKDNYDADPESYPMDLDTWTAFIESGTKDGILIPIY